MPYLSATTGTDAWLDAAVAQNGPTYNGVPNPEGNGPPNNGRRLLDNGLAPIINPVQAAEDEGNADGADAIIDGAFSESWLSFHAPGVNVSITA